MLKMKWLGIATATMLLSACSTFSLFSSNSNTTQDLSAFSPLSDKLTNQNAHLIFYRTDSGDANKTVNVSISGEYLASLQQNSFTEAIVCARQQLISTYLTGKDRGYLGKQHGGTNYALPGNAVVYSRVSINEDGQATVLQVNPETAEREMAGTVRQTHTLPRIGKENTCIADMSDVKVSTDNVQ